MQSLFHWLKKKIQPKTVAINNLQLDCDSLTDRYEQILLEISNYMKQNSQVFESIESKQGIELLKAADCIDSFRVLRIKEQLNTASGECDELIKRVEQENPLTEKKQERVQLMSHRLRVLQNYSEQIQHALKSYEHRILDMEESVSQQYPLN